MNIGSLGIQVMPLQGDLFENSGRGIFVDFNYSKINTAFTFLATIEVIVGCEEINCKRRGPVPPNASNVVRTHSRLTRIREKFNYWESLEPGR